MDFISDNSAFEHHSDRAEEILKAIVVNEETTAENMRAVLLAHSILAVAYAVRAQL